MRRILIINSTSCWPILVHPLELLRIRVIQILFLLRTSFIPKQNHVLDVLRLSWNCCSFRPRFRVIKSLKETQFLSLLRFILRRLRGSWLLHLLYPLFIFLHPYLSRVLLYLQLNIQLLNLLILLPHHLLHQLQLRLLLLDQLLHPHHLPLQPLVQRLLVLQLLLVALHIQLQLLLDRDMRSHVRLQLLDHLLVVVRRRVFVLLRLVLLKILDSCLEFFFKFFFIVLDF